MAHLPTNIVGFRGSDSSIILMLRGGIPRPIRDFENSMFSVWRAGIDWRPSLVPAAAVIPAPIAHIKVVAVKKLVVGFLLRTANRSPNMAGF